MICLQSCQCIKKFKIQLSTQGRVGKWGWWWNILSGQHGQSNGSSSLEEKALSFHFIPCSQFHFMSLSKFFVAVLSHFLLRIWCSLHPYYKLMSSFCISKKIKQFHLQTIFFTIFSDTNELGENSGKGCGWAVARARTTKEERNQYQQWDIKWLPTALCPLPLSQE